MLNPATAIVMAPKRVRKAALNQLRNRLGVRARKYPFEMISGGTLSRMLWIMEQYPRSFPGFLWFLQYAGASAGLDVREWGRAYTQKTDNEFFTKAGQGHVAHDLVMASEAVRIDKEANNGNISSFYELPDPMERNRVDPLLPWLASHFDAMLDEPTQEAFQRRWIPTELLAEESKVAREDAGNPRHWTGSSGGAMINYRYSEELPRILDWAEHANPNIFELTPADALLASTQWHRELSGGQNFRCAVPDGVRVAQWPDGAHIDRLVTKDQLRWEGTSMGHCVGGPMAAGGIAPGGGHYWQGVRDGSIAIFSYRDRNGVPWATIEYENRHVPGAPRIVPTCLSGLFRGPLVRARKKAAPNMACWQRGLSADADAESLPPPVLPSISAGPRWLARSVPESTG